MTSLTARLAAGGAAILAAAALAACGSTSTQSPATPTTPAAAPPSAAAAHNATDVAFTSGIIRLEGQARALTGLVAAHTSSPQLHRYATQPGDDTTDSQHMSRMMARWHQVIPSPYQPGAWMGPGMGAAMMSDHDWADMHHQYGQEFNSHWLDAMIHNRSAELALCQQELRAGASPQARHMAQAMLTERHAQLAQLQRWHHAMEHNRAHE